MGWVSLGGLRGFNPGSHALGGAASSGRMGRDAPPYPQEAGAGVMRPPRWAPALKWPAALSAPLAGFCLPLRGYPGAGFAWPGRTPLSGRSSSEVPAGVAPGVPLWAPWARLHPAGLTSVGGLPPPGLCPQKTLGGVRGDAGVTCSRRYVDDVSLADRHHHHVTDLDPSGH